MVSGQIMSKVEPQPPKIEFPCADYPIKIIGDNCDEFIDTVVSIVCKHCPDFEQQVEQHLSSNGRFISVRVCITAHGEEHLSKLNEALRETGMVRMVL